VSLRETGTERGSPPLAVAGLTVRRGRPPRAVLEAVTLTVETGEIVGLVGANGAGKTTLISAVLDFVDIEPGSTLRLFGQNHRARGVRTGIAYLPERFAPPRAVTGAAFVDFVAGLDGRRPARDAVDALAAEFALDPAVLDRPVAEYSKGMTQKLGLVATFVTGPELAILDEPMTGLDPAARVAFGQALAARRASGMAILMSSHVMPDVERLSDRLLVLDAGRVLYDGTAAELVAATASVDLEAAFIAWVGRARSTTAPMGDHLPTG